MDELTTLDDRPMRLRYPGTCRVCGVALPARTEAVWERSSRTVRCIDHPEDATVADHADLPRLGAPLLGVSGRSLSTTAWATGTIGEEKLGRRLDAVASDSIRVLHDRGVPGGRANIDHLVVTPSGVHVIDAKRYQGRPRHDVRGGLLSPRTERLLVGSRDRTLFVDGMHGQIALVRNLLDDAVPVHGVLCFVDADWPLLGGAFTIRGVDVMWPRRLTRRLQAPGVLTDAAIAEAHRRLAATLRPA